MNIICKIFCPAQIQIKLLETMRTDLEVAKFSLERDLPDVTNAKHYLNLALIVINVLLKKE
jgi:hypothetical protein